MRTKLTCLFAVISFIANAQFRLQPQVGLENSRTSVQYNKLAAFAPIGIQFAPRLGLKMDYLFKHGHGPFVAVATSSPAIHYTFTDPQTANSNYQATKQNLQLRFEGGYQVSTKPIYFSKKPLAPVAQRMYRYNSGEHKCGSSEQKLSSNIGGCRHYCERSCSKSSSTSNSASSSRSSYSHKEQNKGWFMRIVPSAGVALIPTVKNDIVINHQGTQTNYLYKAGAWNTAFITGAGFEFGENKTSKFIFNINYLKGIGNMGTKTIDNVSNGKSQITTFSSKASSWNVSLGIPLSFAKQKASQKGHCQGSMYKSRCSQYYHSYQQ